VDGWTGHRGDEREGERVEMLGGEIAIEGTAPNHLYADAAGISSMRSARRRLIIAGAALFFAGRRVFRDALESFRKGEWS